MVVAAGILLFTVRHLAREIGMIEKLTYIESGDTSPYYNLALEKYLLLHCREGECILYLWQNQSTVVVGRNQNVRKECRVEVLEKEGVCLARRMSGGGAVYQDLGNLNFTFLMKREDYDVERQTQIVLNASERTGAHALKSVRNDLLIDGKKFSGHAYYACGDSCYHHGTLMVCVDLGRMSRYLTVSKEKLQLKGIDSVRARVMNLTELVPELTVGILKEKMLESCEEMYGLRAVRMETQEVDQEAIQEEQKRLASPDWIFGKKYTERQINLPLSIT